MMKSTLTIIPAKHGSTRLPQKNIRQLAGKPMLNYTIDAAAESQICGEIMVSTENDEIAEIARTAGAKIPFMRPQYLGRDPYGVVDVCMHVLEEYGRKNILFEKLIILLPTSPLRSAQDIVAANDIFEKQQAKFLMSVSEFEHNPLSALRYHEKSKDVMIPCFPEYIGKKRHEIPKTFRPNGAVTILETKAFLAAGTYYGSPLHTYIMPWQRSIDIDTAFDFKLAEFLMHEEV